MSERAPRRYPAMAASALLHLGLLLAGIIAWPWMNKPIHIASAVPVTLMTSNELADLRSAEQAPVPTPAATPTPVPDAAPQAPAAVEAPEPAPSPVPPQPKPAPQPPKPAQAKPQPAPAKPEAKAAPPKPQTPSFDPDALLASLNKQAKASGAHQSSAQRGPARPQTAPQAHVGAGSGDAASQNKMAQQIGQLWRPNCEVDGGRNVEVQVSFHLGPRGAIVGNVTVNGAGASPAVVQAATLRAQDAAMAAAPFAGLPQNFYNQDFNFHFHARDFCG